MGPGKRPDRNKCTEEDNLIRGSSGGGGGGTQHNVNTDYTFACLGYTFDQIYHLCIVRGVRFPRAGWWLVELQTNLREVCSSITTEKAPTGAFAWFKMATTAFTF